MAETDPPSSIPTNSTTPGGPSPRPGKDTVTVGNAPLAGTAPSGVTTRPDVTPERVTLRATASPSNEASLNTTVDGVSLSASADINDLPPPPLETPPQPATEGVGRAAGFGSGNFRGQAIDTDLVARIDEQERALRQLTTEVAKLRARQDAQEQSRFGIGANELTQSNRHRSCSGER